MRVVLLHRRFFRHDFLGGLLRNGFLDRRLFRNNFLDGRRHGFKRAAQLDAGRNFRVLCNRAIRPVSGDLSQRRSNRLQSQKECCRKCGRRTEVGCHGFIS